MKNVGTFFLAFVLGFSGIVFVSQDGTKIFETNVAEAFRSVSEPVYHGQRASRTNGYVFGPDVLGVEFDPSTCESYIYNYLKFGASNDVEDTAQLQSFLNDFMDADLVLNGIFDFATFTAVKNLQAVYALEILQPWIDGGVVSELAPTGYVYKTTRHFINSTQCEDLDIPVPTL